MFASQTTRHRCLIATVMLIGLTSVSASRAGAWIGKTSLADKILSRRQVPVDVPSAGNQDQPKAIHQPSVARLDSVSSPTEEALRLMLLASLMIGSPYGVSPASTTTGGASSGPTNVGSPSVTAPDTPLLPPTKIVQIPTQVTPIGTTPQIPSTPGTPDHKGVPEPSTIITTLIGGGLTGFLAFLRRRRKEPDPGNPPEPVPGLVP